MHEIKNKAMITETCFRFITVDPGLNHHTGWSIWERNDHGFKPIETGVVDAPRKDGDWSFEAFSIANKLRAWGKYCDRGFIEMPELWSGSALSQAAAARGDLFKLSFLVGSIYTALTMVNVDSTILLPREWKGQLKKEMVDRRIWKALNKKFPNHISDAVGIGLFVIGKL